MKVCYGGVQISFETWMGLPAWQRKAIRDDLNEVIREENDAIDAARAATGE